MTPSPGWYADPEHAHQQRYWDGATWTEHRHPAPAAAVVVAEAVPVAPVYAPPVEAPVSQTPVLYAPPAHAAPVAAYAAPVFLAPQVAPGTATSAQGHGLSSGGKRLGGQLMDGLLSFLLAITFLGYFIWSMIAWTRGQTPGKAVLGMVVVDAKTGQRVGWGRMFLRQVIGMGLLGVLTLGITLIVSCFMIPGGERKQAVWDKVAGTLVVDAAANGTLA